ncbi:MAG TPA: dienelactone hydrolase family protein [Pirellulales bacterium]|jgi:carboxymethylenebutenolidase
MDRPRHSRRYLCGGLSVLALLVATAQAEPASEGKSAEESPRHQEWVQVSAAGERTLRTFVVYPEVNQPAHAVVVIHENRGLTPWERGLADELAAAGFIAIVPDLLSQAGPQKGGADSFESAGAAREAIHNLSTEQVMADIDGVVDYAMKLSAADKKVVVAGFCWGGGQAFRFAAHNPEIAAAMVFYGAAPNEEQMKQIRVPVYGFYGENDFRITGEVPKVKGKMKALGKDFQPVTYAGAGHGFLRAGEAVDAKPADRNARADAWKRLKDLLSKL